MSDDPIETKKRDKGPPQQDPNLYHGEFIRAVWGELEDALAKNNLKGALTNFNKLKDLVINHSYINETIRCNKLDMDSKDTRLKNYEVIVRQYQAKEQEYKKRIEALQTDNDMLRIAIEQHNKNK